jgi:hypothetical protein
MRDFLVVEWLFANVTLRNRVGVRLKHSDEVESTENASGSRIREHVVFRPNARFSVYRSGNSLAYSNLQKAFILMQAC